MEVWDLYDMNRQKTGETMIRGYKIPEDRYRISVHVAIFNGEGKMLIQQRQSTKRAFANLWDISAGGCVVAGETSQMGIERELFEELGIRHSFERTRPHMTIKYENGFNDVYVLVLPELDLSDVVIQPTEVQAIKWATKEEIMQMIDTEEFISLNKGFIEMLFFFRTHTGTIEGADKLPKREYKPMPT